MSYLIEKVNILYPRLDKTYRFDNTENKSVPCGPLENNAKYETSFVMDGSTATALMGEMAVAYNTARKPNWPEKVPMPFSRDEEEAYVGKCNLKGSFDGKQVTQPPKHFVEFVPYHGGGSIGTGVSLRLRAVQVLTYKPYIAESPFESTDGDFEVSSPFRENTGGFDSTKEVTPTIVFEEEEEEEEEEVAEVIEVPKKKVKSQTAAPKDEVDLSALVANWDD